MKPSKRNREQNTNQFPESKNKKQKNRKVYSGQLKFKEENKMFTRFVMKAVPKLIANPAMAVEMAPALVVAGAAVAIYDWINQ